MKSGAIAIVFSLLLFHSTAIADAVYPPFPQDVTINKEAGCGGHLSVTVRLPSGEELPLDVDTGSPFTIFDESLKSKLGKRLGTAKMSDWGRKQKSGIYAAPELYLGNTLLMTGSNVLTCNFKKLFRGAKHRPMGILGMDCLEHYCIQLDFAAGKMRFLDSAQIATNKLGQAYPLDFSSAGQGKTNFFRTFIHYAGLIGGQGTNLLIDTGLDIDGALEPGILQEQRFRPNGNGIRKLDKTIWYFRKCVWNGYTYTNIEVREAAYVVAGKGANILGLRFLARHRVTFDFPNREMYLHRQSIGPLPNDSLVLNDSLVNSLVITGDKLPADVENRLNTVLDKQSLPFWFRWFGGTVNIRKGTDTTTFHYAVVRKSRHDPWKLKRAWATNQNGNTIKTYSVP